MSRLGISPTKQVFMALVNAYASFGNFENAKEVCIVSLNLCVSFLDEFLPVDFSVCC